MIRAKLLSLKCLVYAISTLVLLCCLAEVGLRVYDSVSAQLTRKDLYDRGLLCKSWATHHGLKPAQVYSTKNPDTQERVRVAINSFGIRGAEPAVPKPPGVFRILCLGDESTLAACTPEADTYCRLLQQQLQSLTRLQVEVLNAGVPDYCPLLSYLQLKQRLLGLQPDLVVVSFDMSDVADDYQYRRHTVTDAAGVPLSCAHPRLELPRATGKAQLEDLFLLPGWGRARIGGLWAERVLTEKSRSIETRQGRFAWLEDRAPDWSVYAEQALSPLLAMQDLVKGFYGGLVVVAQPVPWQISPTACDGPHVREEAGVAAGVVFRNRQPFAIIAEFCQQNRLTYFDTTPAFEQARDPDGLYLKNAALLSPTGHQLYATELARFLQQHLSGVWGSTPASPGTPAGGLSQTRSAFVPE